MPHQLCQDPSTVCVRTSPRALADVGDRLDALQAAVGAPVTARRPWQQAWFDAWPQWTPLVVTVERGGDLRAAAVLAVRTDRATARVVPAGDGPSDEVRLPCLDAPSAEQLAAGVQDALDGLRRPWSMQLSHLPPHDPVAAALVARLRHRSLVPGDVSPRLVIGAERALRAHVSRNHHQQTRRQANRLAREGVVRETLQLTDAHDVAAALPEVHEVCRARDAVLGRPSRLDDPAWAGFFDRVVLEHAARGRLRLTLLRLDGALAAYVLVFRDGAVARMWHCRVAPDGERVGAGLLCHDAALEAALADPECEVYDYMRGAEPYKWSMANAATRSQDLRACSGPGRWAAWSAVRSGRHGLLRLADRSPRTAAGLEALRPLLARATSR